MKQDTTQRTALREAAPKEFQFRPRVASHERRAQMVVDANGRIQRVSKLARQMLGYYSEQRIQSSFFQLVHEQHRTRIMWELAEMVGHHRLRAKWLVQLKTGQGTWRWFHARAHNRLHHTDNGGIVLELTPCGTGHRS